MARHLVATGRGVVAALAIAAAACSGDDPAPAPQDPQPPGPAVLVIDARGVVVEAAHVTVNGGLGVGSVVSGGPVSVDDVRGLPSGADASITLTNHSAEELRLGDVVPGDEASAIAVVSDGGADVVVAGGVQAPAGSVAIRAGEGTVRSGGGLVRCRGLVLEAAAIGAPDARLAVELRRTLATETSLSATAGGDVFLDLAGGWSDWELVPHPGGDAPFAAGPIAAGGTVDLLLRPARPEPAVPAGTYLLGGLVAGGDVVVATSDADVAATPIVHVVATTDVLGAGRLDLRTNGDLAVTEDAGDLRVGAIGSLAGDVALEAVAGSIVDAVPGLIAPAMPRVLGRSVLLRADQGGIGAGDALEIDSSWRSAGSLDAVARDGVRLAELEGDLNVGAVVSRQGDVGLQTSSGSILDAVGDAEADVQGADIDLVAHLGGVGSDGDALEIHGAGSLQRQNPLQIDPSVPGVGRLFATADDGVHADEVSGALAVLQATGATGRVHLRVHDSAYAGEALVLLASGEGPDGAMVAGLVSAPLGVSLEAGDDVSIPPGALVASDTSILVSGDAQAPDPDPSGGTTIDVQGDLQAPAVEIAGGSDLDFLQLGNADGINAGGATLVRGAGSDDRFFVRASAGDTTLQGGPGADRFYVSSDATKGLFLAGGFYADDAPLDLLAGDLTRVDGLTIVAGSGGNGGTRDAIFLSAGASTGPLAGALDAGTVSGLGMTGGVVYSADVSTALLVELGSGADTFQVTDPAPNLAHVYGGPGADTITGCAAPSCFAHPD